jgi:hypothetical protein
VIGSGVRLGPDSGASNKPILPSSTLTSPGLYVTRRSPVELGGHVCASSRLQEVAITMTQRTPATSVIGPAVAQTGLDLHCEQSVHARVPSA